MSTITIKDLKTLENVISETEKHTNGTAIKNALFKLKNLVSQRNFCSTKDKNSKVLKKDKNARK